MANPGGTVARQTRKHVFGDEEGECRLCGWYGRLSFEHVPPQSAFNDRKIVLRRGEDVINSDLEKVRGYISHRGSGGYTLCKPCNTKTGAWYGRAFAHFAWTAMTVLLRGGKDPSLYYAYDMFPAGVLKQVVSMFFSSNAPGMHRGHAELAKFVLDKEATGLPPRYRIYGDFNPTSRGRRTGFMAVSSLRSGDVRLLSEVSLAPLGFVLCLSSRPPDDRLEDLTFMASYRCDDWKLISLRLPVLPVHTHFPGDYRDRATVMREAARREVET